MKFHKYLEVVNVGQGDCMILRPKHHCVNENKTYIIDTGDRSAEYISYLDEEDKELSVILTHSHADHIGGLHKLYSCMESVKEIILPFYHNEIVLLAKALQKTLGIENIADDTAPKLLLDEYILSNSLLFKFVENGQNQLKVILGCDGTRLCDHIHFMNPPVVTPGDEKDMEARIEKACDQFSDSIRYDLINWLRARLLHKSRGDTPRLEQEAVFSDPDTEYNELTLSAKGMFVLRFLETNHHHLETLTKKSTTNNLKKVVSELKLTANQASLVFMFTVPVLDNRILFTGDIDTEVFNRMIANGHDLHAEVLKVPHHGSKTGLDEAIIDQIHPQCAIISHGNRRFGRSKDPHPQRETLELLQKKDISIYVTNDVRKDGHTVISKQFNGKWNDIFEVF